jgi:hypothetical protein
MNLGTDFTIGAWVKPYEFESFYEIYKPAGVIPETPEDVMFLSVGRWEPDEDNVKNERASVGWGIRTWMNDDVITRSYANTIASTAASTINLYQLEDHWWLLMIRVNSKFVPADDSFALNMRMYYNENFGGDDFTIPNDYFEDSFLCQHRVGYNHVT